MKAVPVWSSAALEVQKDGKSQRVGISACVPLAVERLPSSCRRSAELGFHGMDIDLIKRLMVGRSSAGTAPIAHLELAKETVGVRAPEGSSVRTK